jgi:hypothetical protein
MVRYNEDGIAGLYDQPKDHNLEKLSESEQAVLLAKVFQSPDPVQDGTCARTLSDLCDFAEARFSALASPTKRRDRFIRRPIQKPRPTFKKKGR